MKRLTVIGTDTGIGKTYVTAALVEAYNAAGKHVFALKPIESGISEAASDTQILAQASRRATDVTGLIQYKQAVAPGLVASPLTDLQPLTEFVETQCQNEWHLATMAGKRAICFIETAGGWLSPVTSNHDVRDFAVRLGNDVLVVGSSALGAINQIRLTVAAVASTNLRIAAIVLSHQKHTNTDLAEQNRGVLESRLSVPIFLIADQVDAARVAQNLLPLLGK